MRRYRLIILVIINCFISILNLNAQKILYASPDKLQPNSFYNVKLYCNGTHFFTSKPTLKLIKTGFEYIPQSGLNILNDTVITLMIFTDGSTIKPGIYDIVINDSIDGTMTKTDGIEIIGAPPKPKIVSITPDTCNRGDTITLRVMGRNTYFNSSNIEIISINFNADIVSTPNKIIYYNDTLMDVSFHLLSKYYGSCDFLYVGKKESVIKIYGALYIRPPDKPIYISHISEDTVSRGSTCRFYIYGSNTKFSLITSKSSISLFGTVSINANSFTVINDTLIDAEFIIPFIDNGLLTLWLNIPTYGQMYLYNCLQVINNQNMMPVILSVTPDSTRRNSWVAIIINCKNTLLTIDNHPNVLLTRNSLPPIQADSVLTINDTTLRVVFWISKTTEPGKWDLMISNAFDGLFTAVGIFNIMVEVGITENITIAPLKIWPNPTNGILNIDVQRKNENYWIQVINSVGQLYYDESLHVSTNHTSTITYDLSLLPKGYYMIIINNGNIITAKELILK